MDVGDTVEIKDAASAGKWRWRGKTGLVVGADNHCLSVRRDDTAEQIRDVRGHFRPPRKRSK